jgi:hypothetical protein
VSDAEPTPPTDGVSAMHFAGWLLVAFLLVAIVDSLFDALFSNLFLWFRLGAGWDGLADYSQHIGISAVSAFMGTLATLWLTRRRESLNRAAWWAVAIGAALGLVRLLLSLPAVAFPSAPGGPTSAIMLLAVASVPFGTALGLAAGWLLFRPTGVFPPLRTSAST